MPVSTVPESLPTQPGGKASRRGFFLGAAATGAAAAAVAVLPQVQTEAVVDAPKPPPEKGGGYSVSAHVQRYYQTARV